MNRLAPGGCGVPGTLAAAALASLTALTGLIATTAAVTPTAARAVVAPHVDTSASPAGDDRVAVALLRRAVRAPGRTSYAGTQFVAAWTGRGTTTIVVEVGHVPGRATTMRVVGGASPMALRSVPVPAGAAGPADPPALLALLAAYDVGLGPVGTVAGRAARAVDARRPGGGLAARFWVDDGSGLLLRRQVYDAAGRPIRASAFVEIRVGGSPAAGRAAAPAPPAAGEPLAAADLARLRSAGWTCPARLPGGMALVDARRHDGDVGPVLHLGYSDGVSTLSVFEQRGTLDPARLAGFFARRERGTVRYEARGSPHRVVWSAGGAVYSVLADAPEETVAAALTALPSEPQREPDGGWDRLRRGARRMLAWANPFG